MRNRNILLTICILTNFISMEFIAKADIGPYDYGDKNSQTLTSKAWEALEPKDYKAVSAYTQKCISFYERQAIVQQNHLHKMPSLDEHFQYWALNDVATCYYLMGEAYFAQKKYTKAKNAYEKVIRKFYFAQYYDPAGFTVKVAESCEKKIIAIEALSPKTKESQSEKGVVERIDVRKILKEYEEDSRQKWQKPILKDNDK